MVDSKDVISVKIEKINDTQIRCTLTSEDLADRQLKLSELAYGSEKAKDLFRDMMLQAQDQFGFEADNVPLMIEAIPITPDSIVLIITKVEDPEELDTRFSKFAAGTDETAPSQTEGPSVTRIFCFKLFHFTAGCQINFLSDFGNRKPVSRYTGYSFVPLYLFR